MTTNMDPDPRTVLTVHLEGHDDLPEANRPALRVLNPRRITTKRLKGHIVKIRSLDVQNDRYLEEYEEAINGITEEVAGIAVGWLNIVDADTGAPAKFDIKNVTECLEQHISEMDLMDLAGLVIAASALDHAGKKRSASPPGSPARSSASDVLAGSASTNQAEEAPSSSPARLAKTAGSTTVPDVMAPDSSNSPVVPTES